MPKLSVIVPVYNTEKYIEKCLDSIANQTMQDLEIVIINDGSEDNSETVINRWLEKNKNIDAKYFAKENVGLSDARNYAITKANGKYISFVDSDDYIDIDLYKNLNEYMDENIDLIKFKLKTVDEEGNIIEKLEGPTFEKCTGEEGFEKLCGYDQYIDPACIYLYRKEFWVNNKFKYELGAYHEDFGLTPFVIINAKTFVSTEQYGYNYLQTNNSITRGNDRKKNIKKAKDVLKHYDIMIKKIENYNVTDKTKELIKRYYTNTVILKGKELQTQKEDFEIYIKEIKKRKLYQNIKPYNLKQLIKRIILRISVKLYLKVR